MQTDQSTKYTALSEIRRILRDWQNTIVVKATVYDRVHVGRAIEAAENAEEAVFNFLNTLASYLDDEQAAKEIREFFKEPEGNE